MCNNWKIENYIWGMSSIWSIQMLDVLQIRLAPEGYQIYSFISLISLYTMIWKYGESSWKQIKYWHRWNKMKC